MHVASKYSFVDLITPQPEQSIFLPFLNYLLFFVINATLAGKYSVLPELYDVC